MYIVSGLVKYDLPSTWTHNQHYHVVPVTIKENETEYNEVLKIVEETMGAYSNHSTSTPITDIIEVRCGLQNKRIKIFTKYSFQFCTIFSDRPIGL